MPQSKRRKKFYNRYYQQTHKPQLARYQKLRRKRIKFEKEKLALEMKYWKQILPAITEKFREENYE